MAQRLKLRWLTFSKTFNVRKRLAYNADHAKLCLIKGLEFMKLSTTSSKAPLMTFEVFLIVQSLLSQLVLPMRDLGQVTVPNQKYLLREIKTIVRALQLGTESDLKEEMEQLMFRK